MAKARAKTGAKAVPKTEAVPAVGTAAAPVPETRVEATPRPDRADPYRIGALHAVVRDLVDGDTGASAAFRRLDPEDPVGAPALHAALARAGIPNALLVDDGMERYACCVRVIALMETVGGEAMWLGNGLAEIELSEQRVARLSVARDRALRDLVTGTVRRAVSAGVRMRTWGLCEIVLADGRDDAVADAARRDMLRSYYRAQDSKDRAGKAA